MEHREETGLVVLTTDIVISYLEKNSINADQVGDLIKSVHTALSKVGSAEEAEPEAVNETKSRMEIRRSITDDYLISFVDGRNYRTLKRHLTLHGMTPDEYRTRFGLPADYPMVAPSYSAARSEMAKKIGLGAKGRGGAAAPAPKPARKKPAPKVSEPAA